MPKVTAPNRGALLTVKEAAERLNVSSRTVRRLIDTGELPVVRIGRSIRIDETDLETAIARWRQHVV